MQVVSEQDAKQTDAIEQLEDSFSSRVLGKYGLEKTISLCLLHSCQQTACIELLESLLCSEQAEKQNALDEIAALQLELGEINKVIAPHQPWLQKMLDALSQARESVECTRLALAAEKVNVTRLNEIGETRM